MKAINHPTTSHKAPKFATLTALAAACAMMLSAPVHAAEADTAVPSAIDSTKRVIRLAKPNTAVSTAQTDAQMNTEIPNNIQQNSIQPNNVAQPTFAQGNNAQQSNVQQANAQPNRAPLNTTNMAQPPAVPAPNAPELTGTTRVYERGPMTATGIDLRGGQLPNIPAPQVNISDISFVPTVLIPQQLPLLVPQYLAQSILLNV